MWQGKEITSGVESLINSPGERRRHLGGQTLQDRLDSELAKVRGSEGVPDGALKC
jgi:hypothetical protein